MNTLTEHCTHIRQDILLFSCLTEEELYLSSVELEINYAVWCETYKGLELFDTFEGFKAMLSQQTRPFPFMEESSLNGLTVAQFYFVWAYLDIGVAKNLLGSTKTEMSPTGIPNAEVAAIYAISAVKALLHAKSLLGTEENHLMQAAF